MTPLQNSASGVSSGDFPYFRRIWKNVIVALFGASFVPLLLIGGGMYYYSASVLKDQTLESLRTEVVNHKEAIDRFLQDRTQDLRLLAGNIGLDHLTRPGTIETVFRSLQKELPCFTDLGIIDDQGRHLAYAGPFDLIEKNYREAEWFNDVKERDVYISNVFLGFRNVPHFVIAVKQALPEGYWVLRATVDSAFFDRVVRKIREGKKGDAFLVNRAGVLQTTPRRSGKRMDVWQVRDIERFKGVRESDQGNTLQTMVWLDQVPWLCVVKMDRKETFAEIHKVRNIGIFVFILGGILIVFTVLLTTNYLIGRLEFKRKSIQRLDTQLQYAGRIASAIKLSPGFFLRLKDDLGEIDMMSRWIDTCISESKNPRTLPDEISKSALEIRSKVFHSRKAIDAFLNAIRPVEPMILDINLNDLLDNLAELFDREFHFNRIRLVRDYQEPAPVLRSDPDRIRQVVQNLIFNAVNSIGRDGEVVFTTRTTGDRVRIMVTDSGGGIPEEYLEKIFDPHYSAKPEGMGLGLVICRNILKKLGGILSARNEPGKGATFMVELPVRYVRPEGSDE